MLLLVLNLTGYFKNKHCVCNLFLHFISTFSFIYIAENTCIQNVGFWNQFNSNKESFSLEESDSSQWPVPPPLIVSTVEDSTPINKCTFSYPSQAKCFSSPNPNDPYFRNKPSEYITKVNFFTGLFIFIRNL